MPEVFATTDALRWRARSVVPCLKQRGFGAFGEVEVDGLLFAHTKLNTLELDEPGRQPATSRDGRIKLLLNGEIYNLRHVGRQLGLDGLCSGAQLLAEILARDPQQLGLLRGMYAFVAWDSEAQQLLAARDPFGIKSLYVLRHSSGELSLASQIAPLLRDPEARHVDHVGLSTYLAFGHTGPGLTSFTAVSKLAPGCLHRWRRCSVGYERSAMMPTPSPAVTGDLESALHDSVRAHLMADKEVDTFLGSGAESTLLTYLAAQERRQVRTFTVSLPEGPEGNETAIASHNARLIGSDHTVVPAATADLARAARLFLREHGEPFADAAMLPLTHLSLAVGGTSRGVLCGDGARELFGGYARYRVSNQLPRSRLLPLPRRQRAANWWGLRRGGGFGKLAIEAVLAGGGFRSHSALLDGDLPLLGALDPIARRDVHALTSSGWRTSAGGEMGRARRYDSDVWLPNVSLQKTERSTMAGILKRRLPFLDHEVTTAAAREPLVADASMAPLRRLLTQWLPGVQLPDRENGAAVDVRTLVLRHFVRQVEHQLVDPLAALSQWRGRPDDGQARRRAERSPSFAFRLAMLDEWQTLFGNDLIWEHVCRA